jgi:hypothetical protein
MCKLEKRYRSRWRGWFEPRWSFHRGAHGCRFGFAAGRFASEADFLAMAPRRYADHLAAEDGLRAIAEAGIDAGRYTLFANAADPDARHEGALARLRERLDAFS